MTDKRESRDPFDARYDTDSETEETTKMTETAETSQTAENAENTETSETSKTSKTIRERKNVNMYLPEDLVEEMNIRYSELNAQWVREHDGEDLPKNQEFYPAVVQAALNETSIESELGLAD